MKWPDNNSYKLRVNVKQSITTSSRANIRSRVRRESEEQNEGSTKGGENHAHEPGESTADDLKEGGDSGSHRSGLRGRE